jgi:hypothetical protein
VNKMAVIVVRWVILNSTFKHGNVLLIKTKFDDGNKDIGVI